jgi:hypothetical protein
MNPAPTMLWLWPAIAITLGLIGLIVLAFALFRDRSRGGRRCPKCWYSMDGAPTLTCPECGNVAKSEKKLFKTRRSRRGIAVALALFIAAYGVWKWPIVQRDGWTSLIPTTVLALVAPAGDPASPRMAIYMGMFSGAKTKPKSLGETLEYAVWDRLKSGIPLWQAEMYMRRCFAARGYDPRDWVWSPRVWLENEPVPVVLRPPWGPVAMHVAVTLPEHGTAFDATRGLWRVELDPSQPPSVLMEVRFHDQLVYRVRTPLSIELKSDGSSRLKALDTDDAAQLVAATVDPRIVRDDGNLKIIVNDRRYSDRQKRVTFGVGYELRIEVNGGVLATGTSHAHWDYHVLKTWNEVPMEWRPGALELLNESTDGAVFVLRGPPDEVPEEFRSWPFNKFDSQWWSGEIRVPVRVEDLIEMSS